MNSRRCFRVLAVVSALLFFGSLGVELARADTTLTDDSPTTFEADVRPILKAHCFQCHGEQGMLKGGLDLRLRRLIAAGGDSGPAIVAQQPEASYLLERVRSGEMPPGKGSPKLTAEQIAVVERWIAGGAMTARPEPEKIESDFLITDEDRRFWSFQPIRKPSAPKPARVEQVRTPIDAFLLHELERRGETFSPQADRPILVRRAYFDLIGLPPSVQEMKEALADSSAMWFERLIDHLLASPHYGERWGRHWLDVAGYADSDGYTPEDPVREHAFRYRDYVIRAFNADKPFDEFVREQLAGDEMVPPPHQDLTLEQVDKLAATGLLLMAPNPLASRTGDNPRQSHDIWVSETIKIVSTALLGLSVGCSQCHDHRFDPISQEDYYRFRAIFEPALDLNRWRNPRQQAISLYTDTDRLRAKQVEDKAKMVDQRRHLAEQAAYRKVLERELESVPEADRDAVRAAHEAPQSKRTMEQRMLLRQYPRLNFNVSNLPVYDRAAAAEIMKIAEEAAQIRAGIEKEGFVQAVVETGDRPPKTFLLARGDFQQPKAEMKPDELTILKTTETPLVPLDDARLPSTGRRTAYARRLTDGTHPLTARVLVNRVWMHHFGRGICETPADFGTQGARPSHPDLLNWLAREFMDDGWSLKRLHRLVMTSTAYRQALRRSEALERADPENRLLGGFPARRLEAEVLRDSILAINGKLNRKQFGPPVPVMRDPSGEIVVGIEKLNAGLPGPPVSLHGEEFRRSIYIQARRSRPLTMLQTFDAPMMEPNCAARTSSTVAPQSLMLMNNAFVVEQSRAFAERVRDGRAGDLRAQIVEAWNVALSRPPSEKEVVEMLDFLREQAALFEKLPKPAPTNQAAAANFKSNAAVNATAFVGHPQITLAEPEFEALALLCQTLLSCNEFLYVD